MTTQPEVHPGLGPLAALLGVWRGRGSGVYPTIESFEYLEEVIFGHVGKPFLAYSQKTKDLVTEQPLHAETGYMRPGSGGVAEWVITQPTGIVEVLTARQGFDFSSDSIVLTPSAKLVTSVRRTLQVQGDVLTYEVHMAAVGEPMQLHLTGELQRAS